MQSLETRVKAEKETMARLSIVKRLVTYTDSTDVMPCEQEI
jgi:hypothetical protein